MRITTSVIVAAIAVAAPVAGFAKSTLISDVYGQDVYDKGQNKLGKIDNIQVDESGRITKVIIGVGGFLGMGEKDVAVPYKQIKWTTKDNKTWMELDRSKDQLKAAPAVDSSGNPKK